MASADCVNGMLPEGFLDCTYYNPSSSCWFSPRISFSRDFVEEEESKKASSEQKMVIKDDDDEEEEGEDLEVVVVGSVKNELIQKVGNDLDFGDFEFRLEEDPVKMLAADELFSDGKLVPRQLKTMRDPVIADSSTVSSSEEEEEIISSVPETAKAFRRMDISDAELYLFSPKAPRCSSRWKELLGLKRNNNQNLKSPDQNQNQKISSSYSSKNGPLKHFLHRNNPKSLDSSLNLPLIRDPDSSEIVHLPNSLSSSSSSSASSSSNHDEHPRLSSDSDPKHTSPISLNRNPPRVRLSPKSRPPTGSSSSSETIQQHHTSARRSMHRVSSSDQSSNQSIIGLTIDSPRMSSSGKIVFQSLERSSSSPSTFNGGPRVKHRGVERSYSANVRVTPVLNVLRGSSKSGGGGSVFGFFSTNASTNATVQKRGDNNGSTSIRNHHHHHHTNRNRSSTATNSTNDRN